MSRAFMKKRNTFRPTDIGGCTLWLDGADPAGTGVAPVAGSTITTWADKSTSANNATAYGTVTVNTLVNGKLAMLTTASSGFFGYLTNSTTTATTFVVATYVNANAYNRLFAVSSGTLTEYNNPGVALFACAINGASMGPFYNSQNVTPVTSGPITQNQPFIMTTLFTGTQCRVNLNGISTTTSPVNISTSFSYTYYGIGTHANGFGSVGECWNGIIAEVIHYQAALSVQNYQQVEAYLSQKWGLRQQIPQSHPGTTGIVYSQQSIPKALSLPYQNIFTPTSIGGCQIWMDAADITSFTFSSGSNISLWKDKSGYSNNFTTVSGTNTRIADGGYSVVSFSNGNYMTSANQVNLTTSSAVFIVCKVLNTGFNMILACTNITSGNNLGDFSIRTISGVLYGTANFNNGDDFGNQNYYVNGTFNPAFGSSTYVNTYSIIDTLVPGKSGTTYLTFSSPFFSRYLNGNIAEFIFYPGGVSNPDRQQIEGYLAWKWGLQGSLDSSNPYKNSSPSTTNPAGISRPVGLPVRSIACYPTPNTQLFTVTFTYLATGDHSQTFQVPAAISPAKLTVYMWGAGGGGTTGTSRPTNYGGAGAYIQGILTVTPGETLGIIVGQGGIAITSNGAAAATTYGGGGGVPSGGNSTQNSSGGGRSAIQRAAADIVTAGAGGGSGMTNTGANPTSPVAYTLAGGAAAWTGTASAGDYPSSSSYAGQGGTTSGGGLSGNKALGDAAAAANGSQYTGGSAGQYGGGGGGGYYGGGGGTDDGGWGHGGGGGSSYTNLLANPTGSNSTNGYSAPNTSSPYYQSNVGAGGTTGVGGNGLIVLTYYA